MDLKMETVIVLLLSCGIALSIAAHLFAVFPFDLSVTHELQEVNNPAFSAVMRGVTFLGDPWSEVALILAVTLFLLYRHMRIEAIFVMATISSVVLTAVLKVLVGRPRPPLYLSNLADLFLAIDRYSFPSGHVLFFVVFFGFVGYLGGVHLSGWLRILLVSLCGALIVLIAPSRIFLGAHWASDVIGSYVIGTLLLIILILLYQHRVRESCLPD
ncbi:undecaprenyl-diphosphatase [Methanolinea mesophila]|uniref:phosphatase PAP2 family protein n=1 Tax=Methanolinea mesophila TaxID=547055 RepID=UPI001AE702AC|nr:phosphatase PAP2 family protein [Methanolinea mesophila]MBP1929051.1 undecaprenyl-diphosphatase [Methanolinea mesophila]